MIIYEKEVYHYLMLHFPIALFLTGYIFDLLYISIGNSLFYKFGFWNLGIGIILIIDSNKLDKLDKHLKSINETYTVMGTVV